MVVCGFFQLSGQTQSVLFLAQAKQTGRLSSHFFRLSLHLRHPVLFRLCAIMIVGSRETGCTHNSYPLVEVRRSDGHKYARVDTPAGVFQPWIWESKREGDDMYALPANRKETPAVTEVVEELRVCGPQSPAARVGRA